MGRTFKKSASVTDAAKLLSTFKKSASVTDTAKLNTILMHIFANAYKFYTF